MIDYQTAFGAVTRDPRYLRNLDWGRVRPGHQEGTIRAHILELEQNLTALSPKLREADCWKLRLLIHTHDSFKADADRHAAISAPQSHASLARAFLAEFCDDADLLAMVQYHDEPFAIWRGLKSKGALDQRRVGALLANIQDWNLFLAFQIIDGCTKGKSREPLHWFFNEIGGRVDSTFNEHDIIA